MNAKTTSYLLPTIFYIEFMTSGVILPHMTEDQIKEFIRLRYVAQGIEADKQQQSKQSSITELIDE